MLSVVRQPAENPAQTNLPRAAELPPGSSIPPELAAHRRVLEELARRHRDDIARLKAADGARLSGLQAVEAIVRRRIGEIGALATRQAEDGRVATEGLRDGIARQAAHIERLSRVLGRYTGERRRPGAAGAGRVEAGEPAETLGRRPLVVLARSIGAALRSWRRGHAIRTRETRLLAVIAPSDTTGPALRAFGIGRRDQRLRAACDALGFDPGFYLRSNPDVAMMTRHPLFHYIEHGVREGRLPSATPPRRPPTSNEAEMPARSDPADAARDRFEAEMLLVGGSGFFDAEWYAARNPDLAGSDLLAHFVTYGGREGRAPGPGFDSGWYLSRHPDVRLAGGNPLTDYLTRGLAAGSEPCPPATAVAAARAVLVQNRAFEPDLADDPRLGDVGRLAVQHSVRRDDLPDAWRRLFGQLSGRTDFIVVVPWMIRGGADRVAANVVRAACEEHGPEATLVVVADSDRLEALDWLPHGVEVVVLSDLAPALDTAARARLVEMLVLALRPRAVLNVNSLACWEAYRLSGRGLSLATRLHAALFCQDFFADGRAGGYADTHFRVCQPHLAATYSDNATFVAELSQRYGLPSVARERLHVLHQPVTRLPVALRRSGAAGTRVLWASRICRQKDLDLLARIARATPEMQFDVFGSGDPDEVEGLRGATADLGNLTLKGPFAGFRELRTESYAAFLYTSRWDGLPNVLLEAAASGLPIVASDVGGVAELVDAETGWLIPSPEPNLFREALADVVLRPDEARRRSGAAMRRIESRHGWASFKSKLLAPGAFLAPSRPERPVTAAPHLVPDEVHPSAAFDITAIITLHREGLIAHASFESLRAAVAFAAERSLRVEVIIALDRADAATSEIAVEAAGRLETVSTLVLAFGDPGRSRSAAAARAQGRHIAFLDGDDLWSRDWLLKAHDAALVDPRPIVWHPEVNLYFGADAHLFVHVDMEEPGFSLPELAYENYWTALCFVDRAVLLASPHPASSLPDQIGFEDWSWNMQTIAAGILHKTVPGTAHAIRRRPGSVSKASAAAGCLPDAGTLFRDTLAG